MIRGMGKGGKRDATVVRARSDGFDRSDVSVCVCFVFFVLFVFFVCFTCPFLGRLLVRMLEDDEEDEGDLARRRRFSGRAVTG